MEAYSSGRKRSRKLKAPSIDPPAQKVDHSSDAPATSFIATPTYQPPYQNLTFNANDVNDDLSGHRLSIFWQVMDVPGLKQTNSLKKKKETCMFRLPATIVGIVCQEETTANYCQTILSLEKLIK